MYNRKLPVYGMGYAKMTTTWILFTLVCIGIACVGLWAGLSKDKHP